MKLSKEAKRISRELFRTSFTLGGLDDEKVRANARQIAANRPRNYIGILKNYQRLVRIEIEKHHAIVESAVELNWDTRWKIEQSLKAKHGTALTIDFKINSDLIGGLRVQIGNDVWNGSVHGRLQRLKDEIASA
jgi:F-type H+-transporting ATPase subunit delta